MELKSPTQSALNAEDQKYQISTVFWWKNQKKIKQTSKKEERKPTEEK